MKRDARAVRAEVDRAQVGVGREHADVVERQPELLADDDREHRIAALADVVGAAKHPRPTAAVEADLHAGLRHLVGVDRVVGARDVGRARDPEPAPVRQRRAAAPSSPMAASTLSRHSRKPLDADAQLVDRLRVGADDVAAAQLDRVDAERLRGLVELDLEGEARLHAAVPALGPARRLVGVGARASRSGRSRRLRRAQQLARVVGRHQAEARVGAAVEQRLGVDRRDACRPATKPVRYFIFIGWRPRWA